MISDKNIIYLSTSILPSKQANSIQVMKMCAAFAKKGHHVTLFARTSKYYRGIVDDIFKIYAVDSKFAIHLFKYIIPVGTSIIALPWLLYWLLIKNKFDNIVFARDIYAGYMACVFGFEVIYEVHSWPASALVRLVEKRLFCHANLLKVVCISKVLSDEYSKKYPSLINKIEVHHDAADPVELDDVVSQGIIVKKSGKLNVGYIGQLYKGKGVEVAIQCAIRLPQYDFHIVGGSDKDVKLLDPGIDNLHFYGYIDQYKIPSIRNDLDILLVPFQPDDKINNYSNYKWQSPLKIFEYMSSQKAIVASDMPMIREVLNNNNAVLVDPTNIDMWVSSILLLSDREKRMNLARQARKDQISEHTWEIRCERILSNIRK